MNIAVISDNKIEYFFEGCNIDYISSGECITPDKWVCYDAAFLIEPVDENAVMSWTGHPHIRFLNSINDLNSELEYLFKNLECEKKLLIKTPNFDKLSKYCPYKSDIVQIYLKDESETTRRIRKRVMGKTVSYIETVKIRLTPSLSKEYEERISEAEYNELIKEANEDKHPIVKSRYCFFYQKQYFELDIYDFWKDKATLELELKSENEPYSLPPEIEVIKDVTEDKRYKNSFLAGVSYEDYNTELL